MNDLALAHPYTSVEFFESSSSPLLPITLTSSFPVDCLALLDTGASECFIDSSLCSQYEIPLVPCSIERSLVLIDGSDHCSGPITQITKPLLVKIGTYSCTLSFLVSSFPATQVILGYSFFKAANPVIDWQNKTLTLSSPTPKATGSTKNESIVSFNSVEVPTGNTAFRAGPHIDCVTSEEFEEDLTIFGVDVDSEQNLNCSIAQVPTEYHDYLDVFSKEAADLLPEERPFDCAITLKDPSCSLPFKPIYSLSLNETEAQKQYIEENLKKGFIRPSKSSAGFPQFFVNKKDGGLRPCVDYRDLNALTIKDRTPLPLISDLLDRTTGCKIFSKIDLRGAYNLVRIKPGDEWKTAFRTRYGLFEYLVMPFGLTNAPAVFQRMMNTIFSDILDVFMVVYLDDILVFSPDLESHIEHVKIVLQRLRQYKLFAKLEKCLFHKTSISFLGYVISDGTVAMEPEKIASVSQWPQPTSMKGVQSFLGFCNFYRRFIRNFSQVAKPLTDLTKKNVPFAWTELCEQAFQHLKKTISSNPLLLTVDPLSPFTLQTDASDFAIGAVLCQRNPDTKALHPVAFYSRKLLPAEINYTIHDKELLAIIAALTHWRHYLVGSPHKIQIFSDHKNLLFFQKNRILRPRHARWNLILSEFDFELNFTAGTQNQAADALSRRSDFMGEGDDNQNQQLTLLPRQRWSQISAISFRSNVFDREINTEEDWPLLIAHFLVSDSWPENLPESVLDLCKKEAKNFRLLNNNHLELVRVTDDGPINYLPFDQRTQTIKQFHDTLGHMGLDSILPLIRRRFWFPKLKDAVKKFIRECQICQRNRADSSSASPTPLRPIPPSGMPFERWGMDFVGPLPESKSGNKYIVTAIDYATRWVVAKAYPDKSAASVMNFFYNHIVMEYGPPYEIITDRDKSFLEGALPHYERLLRVKHLPTTSYHPRTNGMVERMHQMLNHSLRCLAQDYMYRWDEFLPQTVFAIRARQHAVTKFSPFYLMFGVEPRLHFDTTPPRNVMKPLDEIEQMEERQEFVARQFDELGMARRSATERSQAQAETMLQRNPEDSSEDSHRFDIGDWVKLKMRKNSKWERQWTGPFVIVKLSYPHTYYLMTFRGDWLNEPVNEERLAHWKGTNAEVINPTDNEELLQDLERENLRVEDDSSEEEDNL